MSASHRLNNKFKKDSAAILITYQVHPVLSQEWSFLFKLHMQINSSHFLITLKLVDALNAQVLDDHVLFKIFSRSGWMAFWNEVS